MDNFRNFLIFLWTLFFLYVFYELYSFYKYQQWLKSLKKQPLKDEYKQIIQNFCLYHILTPTQKQILEYKINRFIAEKEFIGIGLEVTDEMKVTVAFFACIETIGYEEFCYPSLKYIYIYPHPIVLKDVQQGYIKIQELIASGEAIGESVIIAWDEVKRDFHINRNVIIHEFAHELDYEDGMVDGMPPLERTMHDEWAKIIFSEYENLKNYSLKAKKPLKLKLIDKYALTNRAEFFAVLSEYFFSKPDVLKKHFPQIYEEFKKFYKLDTVKVLDVCKHNEIRITKV
ncbi:MAG: zinc-dependent peptidase [Epsilonproteobacteria bacterium]|nr:zinc-dependent peptidase [Campylobacterota bacterium]